MEPRERLISEPIAPVPGAEPADHPNAIGEPVLPSRFRFREGEFRVDAVLASWKSYSPRAANSRGRYVRRHWYRIRTDEGRVLTIYFVRTTATGSRKEKGWSVYSEAVPEDGLA